MELPANLQRVAGSSPLVGAGVQSTIQLLAAPGAAARYRLWYWEWAFFSTADAPLRTWASIDDAVGTLWTQSAAGFAGPKTWWPGGFALSANRVLRALTTCDAANVEIIHWVGYTIEAA